MWSKARTYVFSELLNGMVVSDREDGSIRANTSAQLLVHFNSNSCFTNEMEIHHQHKRHLHKYYETVLHILLGVKHGKTQPLDVAL